MWNPFKSSSEESKAAREFNRRGAELLLELNVYPFGRGLTVPDPEKDPDGYVEFVKGRPRVQVGGDAKKAKAVLEWQREALDHGLDPLTFRAEGSD